MTFYLYGAIHAPTPPPTSWMACVKQTSRHWHSHWIAEPLCPHHHHSWSFHHPLNEVLFLTDSSLSLQSPFSDTECIDSFCKGDLDMEEGLLVKFLSRWLKLNHCTFYHDSSSPRRNILLHIKSWKCRPLPKIASYDFLMVTWKSYKFLYQRNIPNIQTGSEMVTFLLSHSPYSAPYFSWWWGKPYLFFLPEERENQNRAFPTSLKNFPQKYLLINFHEWQGLASIQDRGGWQILG